MKKRIVIALFLFVLMLTSGCTNQKPKTETYIIPWTFGSYTGTPQQKGVDSFYELGEDLLYGCKSC